MLSNRLDDSFFLTLKKNSYSEKFKAVTDVNKAIEDLLVKEKYLNGYARKFSSDLRKNVEGKLEEINEFLRIAGIPYKMIIRANNDDNYTTTLKHVSDKDSIINDNVLSYGEKNFISLILFAYDVVKDSKPNTLIILDDPISSFDNKKNLL